MFSLLLLYNLLRITSSFFSFLLFASYFVLHLKNPVVINIFKPVIINFQPFKNIWFGYRAFIEAYNCICKPMFSVCVQTQFFIPFPYAAIETLIRILSLHVHTALAILLLTTPSI